MPKIQWTNLPLALRDHIRPPHVSSGVPAGVTVNVSLIIQAVNNALHGCGG